MPHGGQSGTILAPRPPRSTTSHGGCTVRRRPRREAQNGVTARVSRLAARLCPAAAGRAQVGKNFRISALSAEWPSGNPPRPREITPFGGLHVARLLLLLAIAALLGSPSARARVAPYTHWLLDPAYEWSTLSRLSQIARAIDGEAAAGRPFPTTTAGLTAFLTSFYGSPDRALDPWGTAFFLTRDAGGLHVASAGRDGHAETHDDLISSPLILP